MENRMKITDLLDRRSIQLNGNPKDKKEALDKMIDLMTASGKIPSLTVCRTKNRCIPHIS